MIYRIWIIILLGIWMNILFYTIVYCADSRELQWLSSQARHGLPEKQRPWRYLPQRLRAHTRTPRLHTTLMLPCVSLSVPFSSNSNLKCHHCHGHWDLLSTSRWCCWPSNFDFSPLRPVLLPTSTLHAQGQSPRNTLLLLTLSLCLVKYGRLGQILSGKSPGLKKNGSSKTLDFM